MVAPEWEKGLLLGDAEQPINSGFLIGEPSEIFRSLYPIVL
jgi:hypothetical protein